jgi:Domain of unknown function (DUF4907)
MKTICSICFCFLLVPFFIRAYSRVCTKFAGGKYQTAAGLSRITDSIHYKIIDGAAQTFGYDIYKHNRMIIHQPSIPCLPGNKGFTRKEDAQKTAMLVIEKIRKGVMPPTISLQEMKWLGAAD